MNKHITGIKDDLPHLACDRRSFLFTIVLMNLSILLLYGLFTTLSSARPSLIERASCTISAGGETLKGIVTPGGACRYSIRYAHAERWGYSSIATDLKYVLLREKIHRADEYRRNQTTTALPPACPQDSGTYVDGASQSEDCLFVVVYTPPTATFTSGLPVLVW